MKHIPLPTDALGNPDFDYMEKYVYSKISFVKKELNGLKSIKDSSISKIDTSNWKPFKINSIFKVNNTNSILKSNVQENGDTPYVTASYENNSVVGYVNYNDNLKEKGGCVFIGGKTLVVSYQGEDFFSNDSHNLVLYPNGEGLFSKEVGLFLATVIKKDLGRFYKWSDSISLKTIKKDYIHLPCNEKGEPDYEYMKQIVLSKMQDCDKKVKKLRSII